MIFVHFKSVPADDDVKAPIRVVAVTQSPLRRGGRLPPLRLGVLTFSAWWP
jgi:hypothetical protein